MQNRKAMIGAIVDILIMVDMGRLTTYHAGKMIVEIIDMRDQIAYKEGQRDALLGADRYNKP